jgi:5-methylcytosine-specific restriction enzyme subunit McrC
MTQTVVLSEFSSAVVRLTAPVAAALAKGAGGALSVETTGSAGEWRISASSYVGSVVLPELEILIKPKVRLENLFALMDAGLPDSAWRPEVFGYGADRQLLPAFAAFFARTVDQLTARGLARSYRPESDRLIALRGRIDFPGLLRQPGLPSPIACRYDEYTADVAENRYLLAAVERVLRVASVDPRTRSLLQHTRGRFEGVAPALPTLDQLDALSYTRLNEHYRPAMRLCRLVIENLSLADHLGDAAASSFLVNMNDLFEDWVTRRLRAALRDRLVVIGQSQLKLDVGGKVSIAPDLEFRDRDRAVYVGDVKYKVSGSGLARSSDYYQLLAYCTTLGLPEGVLIYAQTEGAPPEREIVVRNAETRLWTYRLDLAGTAEDLNRSMLRLADWIHQRQQAGSSPSSWRSQDATFA